ncbi:multidrug effflux MFS transporter [Saezia sanguinis]|uniref:multidrug effflux MFS transporter n=1 Tax=Saezia sanguinis TaxID=1965230 RepID=UPI0030563C01
MNKSNLLIALVLGFVSALGPLAIDMYLPALSSMAHTLQADEGMMHQSLMSFFFGLACGQLFMGPMSDKIGRRKTILIGISLYAVAALGCAFAENAQTLVILRAVQGIGSSVGMAVGLAVVRDLYTGIQAVRLMSLMMLIIGVAPVLAPMMGAAIISHPALSWQMIFITMGTGAVISIVLIVLFLPETSTPQQRAQFRLGQTLKNYGTLLRSGKFIPFVTVAALTQAGFFTYISGSSFFFTELHGLSPLNYSYLFALNAVGMMVAAQTSSRLIARFGTIRVVRVTGVIYAVCSILLLLMAVMKVQWLLPYCIVIFIAATMIPIIMPCCGMMSLAAWGAIAGTASAMMGALQFGSGSLSTGLVGIFANGTAIPMFTAMTVCSVLALVFSYLLWSKQYAMEVSERKPHPVPPQTGVNAEGQKPV